jgi:hypothetical protein
MRTLGEVSTTDRDVAELDDEFAADFTVIVPDGADFDDGDLVVDDDPIEADQASTWLDDVESDLVAHEVTDGADSVDETEAEPTGVASVDVVEESAQIEAREGDLDEASPDILEELRRSNIDGPVVPIAPQDESSSRMRRPKRDPDYDPAPVPVVPPLPRVLGRRPRVRKVTRVVRHVDPWSVFKIALVANAVLYIVLLTAGVLLWNVAYATGTIDNVERFFESFGWSTFEFNGGEIYHNGWIAGLFGVIGLTGLAVLLATLFNLITDLVGGMRFTVLEEEVVESRTSPMRRFVIRRPEPEVPLVIHSDVTGPTIREAVVDDSGAIERTSR